MKSVSLLLLLSLAAPIPAQKKQPTSALCTRDTATETTKQQILVSRTFDNAVPRIAILIRAADLLWPYEQDKALAAFMEAFGLAAQNYKEVGEQTRRVSDSQFAARYSLPDQRFKVIAALAKRDPARARKLSDQMLKEEAADKTTDEQSGQRTAEKLLIAALGFIDTDPAGAVTIARGSLRDPATLQLPGFLYRTAKTNQAVADQLYGEAPGFNPENAFREMGKVDFDGTLAQAAQFSDKSLRGLTTLSVVEPCFARKRRK